MYPKSGAIGAKAGGPPTEKVAMWQCYFSKTKNDST
jgi:hypothetical protein